MGNRISGRIRSNVVFFVALAAIAMLALGGVAWAVKIAPRNSVVSRSIKNGQVKKPDLANAAVVNTKLAALAVSTEKLADNAVTTAKLGDSQVTIPKLSFDPATQTELDALASSDGNPPNTGSNLVHWDNLNGVPAGFADGTDDTGNTANEWHLAGNAGTNPATNFVGTTDDNPLNLRVNNARAFRLEPASDGTNQSPNVIGGIADNAVTAGAFAATIGGGGRSDPADSTTANKVTDNYGTVAGGSNNRAGDNDGDPTNALSATVAGGRSNIASGGEAMVGGGFSNTASGFRATVGGGESNTASGQGAIIGGGQANTASGTKPTVGGGVGNVASNVTAAVGGGQSNTASGSHAVVGGGEANTASGSDATVPGGALNTAGGFLSLAAGRRAQANHQGSFVWADSQNADMASSANDQFIARAQGHFFLQSDSTLDDQSGFLNTSTGAFLSTGGTWTNSSDENLKSRVQKVAPGSVLHKVAKLPISSWQYDAEPGVRHIGPMAQDFYGAFGLGGDNRHIASVDADGVALTAIKGLDKQSQMIKARVAALEHGAVASGGRPAAGTSGSGSIPVPLMALLLVLAAGLGATAALRLQDAIRPSPIAG